MLEGNNRLGLCREGLASPALHGQFGVSLETHALKGPGWKVFARTCKLKLGHPDTGKHVRNGVPCG